VLDTFVPAGSEIRCLLVRRFAEKRYQNGLGSGVWSAGWNYTPLVSALDALLESQQP
jgi:hypothetical protein